MRAMHYSPEGVEGEFSEVRLQDPAYPGPTGSENSQ
jgi:hypothetical protein